MGDILFWLIELVLKAIFHQSRNAAKTTQSMNQQPLASKEESLHRSKPQEIDVWEEYRKKQDALHRAHETKRPK
ncbi:MAG: hypothetical protein ABI904_14005 [Chloroflexota bacterium]